MSLVALEVNGASKLYGLTCRERHLRPRAARLAQEVDPRPRADRHEGHGDGAPGEGHDDPAPGSPQHPRRGLRVDGDVGGSP